MGAHDGADRVDLEQADAVEHTLEMPAGDRARRARVSKSLGRERDAAGGGEREFFLHCGKLSQSLEE
ncbi:hypothetical protein ACHMW7_14800 [Aminobacter sp. UC22_36]|uniref:hypothetical protein n=1 Tax=Aminobacter sp. UC22_36 TaxID=3374549 RepID=UPI003756AF71